MEVIDTDVAVVGAGGTDQAPADFTPIKRIALTLLRNAKGNHTLRCRKIAARTDNLLRPGLRLRRVDSVPPSTYTAVRPQTGAGT